MRRRSAGIPGRFALLFLVVAAAAIPFAEAQTPSGAPALSTLIASLDQGAAARLLRGETLLSLQTKNPKPSFAPANGFVKDKVSSLITKLDPGFFIESLSLYKKPSSPGAWTEAERIALFNEVLALSSLKGLTYYSPSRAQTRVFYETSSVVSGSDGKTALPDPSYTAPPSELTLYARQKDLSFGDNVYRYDYYFRTDALVFVQENITAMNYGIIPAVGKSKLRSMIAVVDSGEYLVVYIASMARAAAVPGMGDRVGKSFSSRAEAMLSWFSGRADRAFARVKK